MEEDVNMGTSIVPNLDSIDSFRVLTSNFDAEYGNSSGGQVLVITKSGTAQVHGSAFEFLRNTGLDARNYFSQERAAYQQNQFGATLGGEPFTEGRELFGDYQGTRLTEGIDTGEIAVPSTAERSGDFSQVPLTGNVNGSNWAALLSARLGRTVTAGEPYASVFPTGRFRRRRGPRRRSTAGFSSHAKHGVSAVCDSGSGRGRDAARRQRWAAQRTGRAEGER